MATGRSSGGFGALDATTRRAFTLGALGGVATIVLDGCGADDANDAPSPTPTPRLGGDAAAATDAAAPAPLASDADIADVSAAPAADGGACLPRAPTPACISSETNPLGPFHKEGAPFRADLRPGGARGEVLHISGVVLARDCVTPLANAEVDVWQADVDAVYDMQGFAFRARVRTDACGRYAFTTVMPGHYLNGNQYRPAHIHYRVTHPAGRQLVTQLYFEGDPYNDIDTILKRSLIIRLEADASSGAPARRGVFDIVLA